MKISVIGTGYVGLVTGTCLAETGNEVICVDIDKDKVEKMRNGVVPIYEPHLDVLFERNIKANRLQFTTSLDEGLEHGEVIFLALPTPEDEDGSADLSYVLNVSKLIGEKIKEYKVIVDKSTVPVGTAKKVKETASQMCPKCHENNVLERSQNHPKKASKSTQNSSPEALLASRGSPGALPGLFPVSSGQGFEVRSTF